jgi:hypothetical protein
MNPNLLSPAYVSAQGYGELGETSEDENIVLVVGLVLGFVGRY